MNPPLSYLPIYTQEELDRCVTVEIGKAIFAERRSNRHVNRWIWLISMAITVAVAAALRKQKFGAELEWYWVPIICVTVNGLCSWFGNKAYFGWMK